MCRRPHAVRIIRRIVDVTVAHGDVGAVRDVHQSVSGLADSKYGMDVESFDGHIIHVIDQ